MGILGELWVKLGLKNEGLNKGLDDSKKKVSGFANYMSKLGGIMGTVFSVGAIVKFTHQTAELANKAAGVRKAFEALNKPNLLADLRRATLGTVDDLQLMQRAVQAKNFKIPLDQLATYLAFATKRANETGQSVDYLVDSIITGLGRQSILILDNLGLSGAEIRDNMKDGASMAEAVGKILKEQMGDAVTEIDKAALATQRLSTAWTNFQTAVGEETAPIWNKIKGWGAALLENATEFTANAPAWKKWVSALFPIVGTGFIFGGSDSASGNATTGTQGGTPTEETEKEKKAVIPLIKALKDEIQAKEDLRNLSANPAEIRQLNNEIEALEEKLKLIQMSTKELKKYNEERIKERNAQSAKIEKVDGLFNILEMQANLKSAKDVMDQAHKEWADGAVRLNEQAIAQQATTLEAIEMLNQAVNAGITNSLGELANVIAGVEGANVGSVVKALLSPLADACISAGLLVMGTGKAIDALRDGLMKFFGGNAVAAGAALVAIGVAAKAGLAAIGKGATNTGGYTNQNVTSFSGGYGVNANNYQQGNNYTLSTTLKGQDLLLSIQRTQQNNKR